MRINDQALEANQKPSPNAEYSSIFEGFRCKSFKTRGCMGIKSGVPLLIMLLVLSCAQLGYSLLSTPLFLQQVTREAVFIAHVKVTGIERPFPDENSVIRLALCDVIEVVKQDNDRAFVFSTSFEDDKLNQVIFSMFTRRDISPVEDGGEYVLFCPSVSLLPSIVGTSRVYPVKNGMISAYLADFPAQETSKEEIEKNRQGGQPPRTEIAVSEFIKQVRAICETALKKIPE